MGKEREAWSHSTLKARLRGLHLEQLVIRRRRRFPLLLSRAVIFVVQSLSLSDSATPWSAAHQASLSFTISWSLLKLIH